MDPAMALEINALARQKLMIDAIAQGNSDIQRFYKNSTIFITGGSGFLGKQLIEKLLRSCEISKVYVLLRPKKGKKIQERLQNLLNEPIFDNLSKNQINFQKKIIPVGGDLVDIRLGIKDEDWNALTREVNVIFHIAAITKFNETLQKATIINIRGTREALVLGKSCKNLRSYVHVSTAYSHAKTNSTSKNVHETFYDIPIPPETMISLAENMDDTTLNNITSELTKNWLNTYTFTKAVAEELVRTTSDGLPICIVRPAIVMSTYREPCPGWINESYTNGAAAAGLVLGFTVGLIHTALAQPHIKISVIPCDYVNNVIIAAAKEASTNQAKGGKNTKIYFVSTAQRNPLKYSELIQKLTWNARNFGTPKSIYYAFVISTSSKFWFKVACLFIYKLPAYVADTLYGLFGKQKRFVKIVEKLFSMMNDSAANFLMNEWNFVDNNLENLFSKLSSQDKNIFNFDVTDINWTEYFLYINIGMRKYIIKDGLKNTEYAIRKQKYFKYAHYTITTLYVYSIWKFVSFVIRNFIGKLRKVSPLKIIAEKKGK